MLVNFLLETMDEPSVITRILLEFFNTKVNSTNVNFLRRELRPFLLSYDKSLLAKKYQKMPGIPLDIVIKHSILEKYKNNTKEELLENFSSKECMNIQNFYKACTMIHICPEFVDKHTQTIVDNIREKRLLLSRIEEISNNHTEHLDELVGELRLKTDTLTNENKRLIARHTSLEKEIQKLKKENNKVENKVKTYEEKTREYEVIKKTLTSELNKLKKEVEKFHREDIVKENQLNQLKADNDKLIKELEENKIKIEVEEFGSKYKLSFVHTMELKLCKQIFPDVLFVTYDELKDKYNNIIQEYKKYEIKNVILQTNKMPTIEIIKVKNKLKEKNINVYMDTLQTERYAIGFISKYLIR